MDESRDKLGKLNIINIVGGGGFIVLFVYTHIFKHLLTD